jgi:hypothetical protein
MSTSEQPVVQPTSSAPVESADALTVKDAANTPTTTPDQTTAQPTTTTNVDHSDSDDDSLLDELNDEDALLAGYRERRLEQLKQE